MSVCKVYKLLSEILTMSVNLLMKSQLVHSDDEMRRNLTPRYMWDEQLRFERERLKTFKTWPLQWLDKTILAKTGMFYLGDGDKTQCYFCEVIIGKWELEDDPIQEHLRWSPNCPLLRRCQTNNEPLCHTAMNEILPPAKPSTYDTPPAEPAKWKTPSSADYSIKAVRLRTFDEWPRSMKQKPEQLAEAGFYYKGVGDSVICFSCMCGLKDWEDDDDPWEQHALWMGHHCEYVKHIKGEQYIKRVLKKFENLPNKNMDTKEQEEKENVTTEQDKDQELEMDSKLCKICYDNVCNTVYIPCGHVMSCTECAFKAKECPLCRASVERTVRLYFC